MKIPTDASQFCLSKAKSDTGLSVLAQLQFIWSVSAPLAFSLDFFIAIFKAMRTYTSQLKLLVFVLNFLYQKSASRQQKKQKKECDQQIFFNSSFPGRTTIKTPAITPKIDRPSERKTILRTIIKNPNGIINFFKLLFFNIVSLLFLYRHLDVHTDALDRQHQNTI